MSGVIDDDGVQWERCDFCAKWQRLDNLGYEPPTREHKYGRMVGLCCINNVPDIEAIEPSPRWVPVYEEV